MKQVIISERFINIGGICATNSLYVRHISYILILFNKDTLPMAD